MRQSIYRTTRLLPLPQRCDSKRLLLVGLVLFSFLSGVAAHAGTVARHHGTNDPLIQGFAKLSNTDEGWTIAPIADDLGLAAWGVAGALPASQLTYASDPLTVFQSEAIAQRGFSLTAVMRPLIQASPAFTPGDPVVIAFANANYNMRRYEIALGLTAAGDMVAVLPTAVDTLGPNGTLRAFGPSFVLENGYQTLQLEYDALLNSAAFLVDGNMLFQGYEGRATDSMAAGALRFGTLSGGESHFHLVELVAVPEPSSILLALIAGALSLVVGLRRKNTTQASQRQSQNLGIGA